MALQSFFGQLLLKLQERITTQVPEIKWIDQDLGQLEDYEMRPAVAWPCVLIDFGSTNYDQMQDGVQWGNAAFTLRLGFAGYSAAQSSAPAPVKEKALAYYEIEQLLYQALQGYDADGLIQPATRITAATEKRDDSYRVRVLVFNTVFMDDSAQAQLSQVPRPILDVDFEL